ncbi:MAG: Brp/Blh family beta-carotene 15,15'-dioxygenase [Bacteroidia bacterium]|nr:Brp/Blh family beta-carotene 15,15'-dioxygenase [Bacteroidia bacterium]
MTAAVRLSKTALIVASLVLVAVPLTETASLVFFGTLLLLVGLPHGALDHVLFRNQFPDRGLRLHIHFYGFYLACLAAFALVWWVLPIVALVGFLAVSGYHFGQTQLTHLPAPRWLQLAWGGWVLSALVYTHPESLHWGFLDVFAGVGQAQLQQVFGYLAWALLAATGVGLLRLVRRWPWAVVVEFAELAAIYLVFASTDFFVSFGLFFGGWHAMRALINLRSELRQGTPENVSLLHLAKEALPHTLASAVGIGAITWLAYWQGIGSQPALVLFMGLSVVALPHIVTVERWQRFRALAQGQKKPGPVQALVTTKTV